MSYMSRVRQLWGALRLTPFDTTTEAGKSKERYRLITLAGASSIAVRVVTVLLGLVSVPLTIGYLGKDQFGLWMAVSSLAVWLQLTDFGISNGLTNALAEANGRDEKQAARAYVTTALAAFFIISIMCIVPVVVLALWLPWQFILNIYDAELAHLPGWCFLVAGLVFVFNLPLSVVRRVFIAYQLGYIVNTIQVVSSIGSLVGLLMAIYLKLSMPWLVFFVSIGPVIGNLLSWFILHKRLPWCRVEWRLISRSALRRVAHSSVPLFFFQTGSLFVNQTVNILLAHLGGLSMVADYNILLKIYMLVFTVGASISSPFYPAIREAFERREWRWVGTSIRRVVLIRLGIYVIPCFILVFLGDWIISIWINQAISGGFGFLGWFLFSMLLIVSGLVSTYSEILIYLDHIYSQLHLVFINAFLLISSSIILVPLMGLPGIYLAYLLSIAYSTIWTINKVKGILKEKNA